MVWLSRWTVREDNHKVELRRMSEINEENSRFLLYATIEISGYISQRW